MKKLILVRHGDYAEENAKRNLTELGEKQMAELATKLKTELGDIKPLILTSPHARTVQSARIIAREFGVQQEECKALNGMVKSTYNEFLYLLQELTTYSVVIAVTHLEFCRDFRPYFFKALNAALPDCEPIRYAEAVLINKDDKTEKFFRRDDQKGEMP